MLGRYGQSWGQQERKHFLLLALLVLLVLLVLVLVLLLLLLLQRGREGEREGKKHQCVVASSAAPTGDLAHNPGMCPDWESNW